MTKRRSKHITVGVVGLSRGKSFVRSAELAGMKLVAVCDKREEALAAAGSSLGVATYLDVDEFLSHDMDAVILANYFHQHAPLAVKALKAGKHVMSETTACKTPAEGVALARAVEKSGKVYMLAENFLTSSTTRRCAGSTMKAKSARCNMARETSIMAPALRGEIRPPELTIGAIIYPPHTTAHMRLLRSCTSRTPGRSA